jgi:fermentation-respiration switch protein FrsA (DUF1100 family)
MTAAGRLALAIAFAALAACAPGRPAGAPRVLHSETHVTLHDHSLTIHLSVPASGAAGPLLVYATGDAGWWGKDKAIFNRLSSDGYVVAGFSARDYVHHLGRDAVPPAVIAADFDAIIHGAETALKLAPLTKVVLVGKSRGAGLAVAAAGRPQLRGELAGVLAVALTKEEEYVRRRRRRTRQFEMLQTYDYLPAIGAVPVAVIQSTHDGYLPAGQARQLFGADSGARRFVAIESKNHNFGGALDELYDEIDRSLSWIVDR